MSAVHLSAKKGDFLSMSILLSYSPNVNLRDKTRNLPIHYAVQSGDKRFCNMYSQ